MTVLDADLDELEQLVMVERVLGAALHDPATFDRLVRLGVTDHEFAHPVHAAVWRAMLRTRDVHQRLDLALVQASLVQHEGGDKPWRQTLEAAHREGRTAVDDETMSIYVDNLRHRSAMRRTQALAETMLKRVAADTPASSIFAEAETAMRSILAGATAKSAQKADALGRSYVERLAMTQAPIERVPTGIPAWDRALRGGVRKGAVLLVGAENGVGKTTFGAHMILTALREGKRVAVWPLESSAADIWDRLVEMQAGARLLDRNDRWTVAKLVEASDALSRMPLVINQTDTITAEEIASTAHALQKEGGLDLVVIDYIQEVERSTRHSRDDLNYMHISKVVRRMTTRLNVATVEFSQLTAPDKDPRTKNSEGPDDRWISFTKQFAKDASAIGMLDRQKTSDDNTLRNVTRCRLIKNRYEGELAKEQMRWSPETTRLTAVDERARKASAVSLPLREVADDDGWDA